MNRPVLITILFAAVVQVLTFQLTFAQVQLDNLGAQWKVSPPVVLLKQDSLEGWTSTGGGAVKPHWTISDGVLTKGKAKNGGDIVTEKEYENFILDFEWRISKGANSGIKYRLKNFKKSDSDPQKEPTPEMPSQIRFGWLGCEYQILDDANNSNGKTSLYSTSALYYIKEPNEKKTLNGADEWNQGQIVVLGNKLEHWLNGEKVMEIEVGTPEWNERIGKSKFALADKYGENSRGYILLQDHNGDVSFRNIVIREITEQQTSPK
ncbi:MAG: 3-keto-disaccharide hydrolase [Thermoguttaceae bacterium]